MDKYSISEYFKQCFNVKSVCTNDLEFKQYFKTNGNDLIWDYNFSDTEGSIFVVISEDINSDIVKASQIGLQLQTAVTNHINIISQNSDNKYLLVFIKEGLNFNSKNATLTWISGKNFCEVPELEVYLNSCSKLNFDHIVFTHDMPIEFRIKLDDLGFKVINVQANDMLSFKNLVYYRFYIYSRFLQTHDYKKIIISDAKDVLFNSDPFDLTPDKEFLFFVKECMLHKQSDWNYQDQKNYQETITLNNFKYDFDDWEVINAGLVLGSKNYIMNLCYTIWMTFINKMCGKYHCSGGSDQAAMNYMYNTYYKYDPNVSILDPKESYLALNCEAISKGFLSINFNDGFKLNDNPYSIIHQWDRTEHKNFYYDKFKF